MARELLKVTDLSTHYAGFGGSRLVKAVDGVSFSLEEGQTISHFMGQPDETRHVFMKNHQAIISPEWSIHSGAGTSNYTFIWGMAGENMDYGDMDGVSPEDLK